MDTARRHPETAALLERQGPYAGKFIFPFAHVVVLNNCTRGQLDELKLSPIFPFGRTFARDEFEALTPDKLVERLKACFDPWWPFERLSDRQISVLRSVIHPEIVLSLPLPPVNTEARPIQVLDVRQERNALSLGEGHRIVYGVAGSGKTVILVARARLVAMDSTKRVLILCFNVALAAHFRQLFSGTRNVACMTFHQWGSQLNGIGFIKDEDEDAFGERLLKRLQNGEGEANKYDAVFVDEAQDFSRTWFMCAKLALKEPDDGDFLIVGDGSQSLYRRRRFTWREAGVNAVGRTVNTRYDLDKNYRNTREIMRIAARFAAPGGGHDDPEAGLQIVRPNPSSAMRSGPPPELLTAPALDRELNVAVDKLLEWRAQGLKPSEIAVLYRANTQGWVGHLASLIAQRIPVHWQHGGSDKFDDASGVRMTTMHSAKGLQWRAVLIVRCDMMPFVPDPQADRTEQERLERGLMYVAMTRAEEFLAFTHSTPNGFAGEIQRLLDHQSPSAERFGTA
jgi:superfamily I DNA/RNA helicase